MSKEVLTITIEAERRADPDRLADAQGCDPDTEPRSLSTRRSGLGAAMPERSEARFPAPTGT